MDVVKCAVTLHCHIAHCSLFYIITYILLNSTFGLRPPIILPVNRKHLQSTQIGNYPLQQASSVFSQPYFDQRSLFFN